MPVGPTSPSASLTQLYHLAVHPYPLQYLVQQLYFKRIWSRDTGKNKTQGQTPEELEGCHSEEGMRSLAHVGSQQN